jgi:bile acid:Na+ symporter, BASS family
VRGRVIAVPDVLEAVSGIAILVTLWATAIALGASHDPRAVRVALERRGLFVRVLVLDLVIVPLVVAGHVRVLSVPTDYAIGLLIVGTASAGPLGLKTSAIARGDLPLAIALVITLELANVVVMPVWAAVILPGGVNPPIVEIWRTLILGILLPLVIGFAIHGWAPGRSLSVSRWAGRLSSVGLAVVVVALVLRDGPLLVDAIGSGVLGLSVGTIVTAFALGWWFGGPDAAARRTAAHVSSFRANTLALAVTSTAFGTADPATSAVVVFGLCSVVLVTAAALVVPGPAATRAGEAS